MRACPHCGAGCEDGAAKCASCGAALRPADKTETGETLESKPVQPPVARGSLAARQGPPQPGAGSRKRGPLAAPSPLPGGPARPALLLDDAPRSKPQTGESAHRSTPHQAFKAGETASIEGAVPAEAQDPLIGQTPLGQYRILRKVGEGGFGAVYLAEQLGVGRNAVIKVLRKRHEQSEHFVRRFEREASVLAALDHHNLVRLYNFGELEDGQLFLAMEYGGDHTLADEIARRGRLPVERALGIAEQVCAALQEAHDRGIVHRDLKPPNILLGEKGGRDWVKVVDVGIAKILDDSDVEMADSSLTASGALIGTPAYFSPEQARGLPVDARSDVYAMGIVLYEMLTAQLPVKGMTPLDFARAHAADVPRPMRSTGALVPAAVEAIVAKALEKDPARRFASALEMSEAIADVRRSPRSPWTGRRRVLLGGVLALAVGVIGIAIGLKAARTSPAPAAPAVQSAPIVPPPPTPTIERPPAQGTPIIQQPPAQAPPIIQPPPAPAVTEATRPPPPRPSPTSRADVRAMRLIAQAGRSGSTSDEAIDKLDLALEQRLSDPVRAKVYRALAATYEGAGNREKALLYYQLYVPFCPPEELPGVDEKINHLK